jgi:Transcriptional regulators
MSTQLNEVFEIKDFLSLINGRINAMLNRYLNRKFKSEGLGITTEQWSVLSCLWEKDKQTQKYICDHTYKDKASITRLLDGLEKNGLVVRVSDSSDRRINLIHLTEKGVKMEKIANNIVSDCIAMSTNKISTEDLRFMIDMFKKIILNISEYENV